MPLPIRAIPFASLVYFVSPLDLVPDRITAIGLMDDLLGLVSGVWLFRKAAPRWIVKEHLEDLESISAKYSIDE